jgi:predicted AlkP superfamily phosphohydrolase/phosphomutase
MDVFLGKFMETFPDCNLILMSDHGGGPYYQDVAINNWLLDHKYLFLKKDRSFLKRIVNSMGLNKVIRRGLNMGLWRILKAFPKTREFVRQKMALTYGDIDWANTLAYSYGYYGPIYINKSIITSKRQFQAIRNQIRVELRKVEDPVSGAALVKNIWNKEELYAGSKAEILPDVIVNMGDYSYACSSTFPFSSGEMFSEPKTFKSGDHTQYGIFMAYGPDIEDGKEIKTATIYDITPTVLHMFNIPIPKDMDGTVLKDIFKGNSAFTRAIKYVSMKEDHGERGKTIGGQELVDTDEETIKEMLKGLGYL